MECVCQCACERFIYCVREFDLFIYLFIYCCYCYYGFNVVFVFACAPICMIVIFRTPDKRRLISKLY